MWQGALVLCALVGGLSGCGTWMHSDKQSVTIFTNPPETAVVIDDYLHLTAPGTVTLSRKGNHLAQVNRDGYEPTSFKIDRTWSWWVVGDIFGCLVIFSPILHHERHRPGRLLYIRRQDLSDAQSPHGIGTELIEVALARIIHE